MIKFMKNLEVFAVQEDSKVLYILSLVVIAMIIDFLTGYLAAWMNKEVVSSKGINGILRKVTSIVVMVFAIPLAPIIPGGVGMAAVYVLYFGYLIMELSSIVENYRKLGMNKEAGVFVKFFGMLNDKKTDNEKEENKD